MKVITPHESFPEPGTVENPAAFYDGEDAFLCYATSGRLGVGNVVLRFAEVIDFRLTPLNVDGLATCQYPISPWAFNEVIESEKAAQWPALKPRFWLISFNDVTIELRFKTVSLLARDPAPKSVPSTLVDILRGLQAEGRWSE